MVTVFRVVAGVMPYFCMLRTLTFYVFGVRVFSRCYLVTMHVFRHYAWSPPIRTLATLANLIVVQMLYNPTNTQLIRVFPQLIRVFLWLVLIFVCGAGTPVRGRRGTGWTEQGWCSCYATLACLRTSPRRRPR